MPDMEDAYLETLLREHLTAELNGELGRPAAAFFAHVVDVHPTGAPIGAKSAHVAPSLPLSRPAAPARFGRQGRASGLNGWFIGLAGAALAASIAALCAAPGVFRAHAPVIPIRAIQSSPAPSPSEIASAAETPDGTATNDLAGLSPSPVQPPMQWVQRRTVDEGTVVLDDPNHAVPARKLREQELDHSQWYDPARRAHMQMTVPRENIKFVEMDTY